MSETTQNYQDQIIVRATPQMCFQAIASQMDKWWTVTTEGAFEKIGDRVTVRFPPHFGFWTFEAQILDAGRRIEMICIAAHHKVEGQPKEIDQEWLGTKIIWEFDVMAETTKVKMTHDGLTPELNCWGICFDGWNQFFKGSLKAYLDGEAPMPYVPA